MNILLTGGAGYIGSHTAVVLSQAGHEVVLLDNFCNSQKTVLERLQKILGRALSCVEGDVRDTTLVAKILQDYKIDAVIHFAGLKSVGESTEKPIEYYANNVQGTISLLEAMNSKNVKMLVFSSSATVYGNPQYLPIDEDHPKSATNAYGRSKLHIEEMLKDVANSDIEWKVICLRYFNPVGAHESSLIGEDPKGVPNNLMPYVAKVVAGELPYLNIYGKDYSTHDGTGVRDYIHVMDLAEGHVAALNHLEQMSGWLPVNLGTGKPASVLDITTIFENICGIKIKKIFMPKRFGDVAICYANSDLAESLFGWKASRSLAEICKSIWMFKVSPAKSDD